MEQTTALRFIIDFLENNKDLPKAQMHMVREGVSGWRVIFELAHTYGNAGTEEYANKWAHAMGAELRTGEKVNCGSYATCELKAQRRVGAKLSIEFRETLVYLYFVNTPERIAA